MKFFRNLSSYFKQNNLSADTSKNSTDEQAKKSLSPNIPEDVSDFQIFLAQLRKPLTSIFENMESFSPFAVYFKRILYGNNNNAGIKNAIDVIGLHEDRTRLSKCFGLAPDTDLKNVSCETFFNGYIKPIFFPILNEIVKLYSYMQIEFTSALMVKNDFIDAKIDVDIFEKIYQSMTSYLQQNYKIEITTVNLFKETFNSDLHQMTEYNRPEFTTLNNEYKEQQNKLSPNIIFDLVSPGIKSEKYFHKPVVIVNM